MATNKKTSKSPVLSSPEQALLAHRQRKKDAAVRKLRKESQRKINRFCGPPMDIPVAGYTLEVIEIVEKELTAINWKVTRHSGLEGQNPVLRLAMNVPEK
ncbi:MAG: hypothetical protein IAF58_02495 [Leptolyngbya sp.]|nr:hypothetical protein [Candidatus Melainabacteria bacterium]